jgi:hypothetical protein
MKRGEIFDLRDVNLTRSLTDEMEVDLDIGKCLENLCYKKDQPRALKRRVAAVRSFHFHVPAIPTMFLMLWPITDTMDISCSTLA